jgi:hypothetical protein
MKSMFYIKTNKYPYWANLKWLPMLGFCLLISSLSIAHAQGEIPDSKRYQDIQFISGGIGSEESDAMLLLGKKWPLTLEFAQDHPQRPLWVADVQVKITNSKKKVVFDALSDGPIMLIELPADQYEIEAKFEERTLKRKIKLEQDKSVKLPIIWPIR